MKCCPSCDRLVLAVVGLLGLCGVLAGALGAPPPEGFLVEEGQRSSWNSAVIFLLFHVLAILALANLREGTLAPFRLSGLLMFAGAILFSGSIFALSAGGPGWLGPVTPVGGLLLMAGWGALFLRLLVGGKN